MQSAECKYNALGVVAVATLQSTPCKYMKGCMCFLYTAGAPDVFTAYSALQQRSDMALLLG